MIPISLPQLADILQAELCNATDCVIEHVSTDSRAIMTGDLFVALVGEHFDGHLYVEKAQLQGAVAAVVERRLPCDMPQLIVADTQKALGQLGQWVKQSCDLQTVAITGSSGKTTVKELTAAILGLQHQVLATAGNFNNEIGVPLTLLRLTPEIDKAVVELGANHLGEIAYTASLVKPDVAVITTIGGAHLEGFGSEQGIANAKFEIFSGLAPQGVAVFDLHSQYGSQWRKQLGQQPVLTWSSQGDESANLWASAIQLETSASQFMLHVGEQAVSVKLPMPGLHNVNNALAAAAACVALGVSLAEIAEGLGQGVRVKGRLESHSLSAKLLVIDDSYNANLGSVKAAIDVLVSDPLQPQTALIFGDMAELGEWAKSHHQQVGEYAKQQGVQALFTLGSWSQTTQEAFGGEGSHHLEFESLMSTLISWISAQQQPLRLLIKGSRSSAMERVLASLKQWQSKTEDASC